jgi:hypothetical protein
VPSSQQYVDELPAACTPQEILNKLLKHDNGFIFQVVGDFFCGVPYSHERP